MSWESNPYYSPEKFGLEIVGEAELSVPNYDFDMLVVWKDADGTLYYAQDSGCSCPSPFEDYNSVDDLHKLTSVDELQEYAKDYDGEIHQESYRNNQVTELIAKVLPLI
jgi:hypothetical protein